MEPEVTLTFNDGRERRVVVHTRGFTIGRAPDNDLVLNYPNLSRRHAVIESSGGGVRIADCGSQNGTLVNGVPADGSVELRDGDVVTLGGLCDLKVGIRAGSGAGISVEHPSDPFAADEYDFEPPATPPPLPGPSRISAPLIAVVSIILISLAAVALIVFLKPDPTGTADAGKASTKEDDPVINSAGKSRRDDVSRPANTPTGPPAVAGTGPPPADVNTEESAGSDSSEQIRRVAKNSLRRFGDEPAPYISQGGLRDVEETVERLRGSNALREQLGVMGRDGSEVAAQARKAGFDPALIIYAALAETSGGGGGGPKTPPPAHTQ
jgi:predicted component of type VI protein secretion system